MVKRICKICNLIFEASKNKITCSNSCSLINNKTHKYNYYIKNKPKSNLYYIQNKEKILKKHKDKNKFTYNKICKICKIKFNTSDFKKLCCCNICKLKNIKLIKKKSFIKHKEKRKLHNNLYISKRKKTNDLYNFKCNLSKRFRRNILNFDKNKIRINNKFEKEILGCSFNNYKKYLEQQFKKDMTWEKIISNKIHIDHIIPLSSAKSKDEVSILFHYTNTQPLWAKDNIKKSNKLEVLELREKDMKEKKE